MSLSMDKRNEIALDYSEFWKENCEDEEFYNNCRDGVEDYLIGLELSEEERNREHSIIMSLIEIKYKYDNWKVREMFEHTSIIILRENDVEEIKDVRINDIVFNDVWCLELSSDNNVRICNANDEIAKVNFWNVVDIEILD